MKQKPKIIEGWFTVAEDYEYGPTLVKWNKSGKPTHMPITGCESLDDKDYDELEEFESCGGTYEGGTFKIYKVRIIVEEEEEVNNER